MDQSVFKVIFYNEGEVYEIYARHIYQSDMYGFIEIEQFLFGEQSQMIVDPGEEKLKNEFSGVKRSYLPVQSIIRIDEVEREGQAKVHGGDGKVARLPVRDRPIPTNKG